MKKMRRSDRQMTNEEAIRLLQEGEYGVLSTVDSEMRPYGVPLSYASLDDTLYIHSAKEGTKLDNIINNSSVCFTVVGKTKVLPGKFSTEYESVIVFGRASIVTGEEKIKGLMELVKKYSPDFIKEGRENAKRAEERITVVKIEIQDLTGKHSA